MASNDDWQDVPHDDDWKDVPAKEGVHPIASFLRGADQALTLGGSDELTAGLETAWDKVMGSGKPWKDLYREKQKVAEGEVDQAREDNPKSYYGGLATGAVGSAFVPGLNILSPTAEAGMAVNVGKAALQGGAQGALSSHGNLDNQDSQNRLLQDSALGAGAGAVLQGANEAVAGVADKIRPDTLRENAAFRGFKSATGQNKRAFKEAVKMDNVFSKGTTALNADEAGPPIVGWISKSEDVVPKAIEKKEFYGNKINEVAKNIDAKMPESISGQKIADNILDYAASLPETEQTKSVINMLQREAENYAKKGNMSFADAQNLKNSYRFDPLSQSFDKRSVNQLKSIVGDEMDSAANMMSHIAQDSGDKSLADVLGQYKDYKDKYGAYATFADKGQDRLAANMSNRTLSPTDYLAAIGGLAHGNVGGAAALAGANNIGRNYGSAFMARGQNAAANALESTPKFLQDLTGGAYQGATSGQLGQAQRQEVIDYVTKERAKRP